jgi:hypothetical protein
MGDSIHAAIVSLSEQGDVLVSPGDNKSGWARYHEARGLIPKPKEHWEAATWVLSA